MPLSSISDFGHSVNNYKIQRSDIRKCKIADCQTKQKIKQDNKSPHRSNADYFVHPIHDDKKIKPTSKIYDTVDHQIELDMNQDYELPLSSIADFLHPIENKFKNKELQRCGTVDNQTEQNNNQDDELTISSIKHSLHPFDNKFIKCEAVNCQSKENTNHYNKSMPNRLICNKEQSTIIDDTSKNYECDICGKIFPKRTDIIKHFKTSLCYPEIIYTF